jgi:hypothetical protein
VVGVKGNLKVQQKSDNRGRKSCKDKRGWAVKVVFEQNLGRV